MERVVQLGEVLILGGSPLSLRDESCLLGDRGAVNLGKDPDKGVHTRKISLYRKCPIKESA